MIPNPDPAPRARRRRWWQLAAILLALLGFKWFLGGWREEHRQFQDWLARDERARQRDTQARADWLRTNPGKLYDYVSFRNEVLKVPGGLAVQDVWEGDVLLSDGSVLLADDMVRRALDPTASLKTAPPGPRLLTLVGRSGAALWSDGSVYASSAEGRGMVLFVLDPYRWRRLRYPFDLMKARPGLPAPNNLHDVTAVASSPINGFVVVLRANGQAHAYGTDNDFGQLGPQGIGPDGVPGFVLDDVTAIAVGDRHALALRRDGSVWMWGQDDLPGARVPIPSEAAQPQPRRIALPRPIVKIAAGARSSFAVDSDGVLWAWGDSECAALGVSPKDPSGLAALYRGIAYVPAYRNFMLAPVKVPGPVDVIGVSSARAHTLALTKEGAVWGWGRNDWGSSGRPEILLAAYTGECGRDMHLPVVPVGEVPHTVAGAGGAVQIFASQNMTAWVRRDHTLWFLGNCPVCGDSAFRVSTYIYLTSEWADTAAKGMWCGSRNEVVRLRKAVDELAVVLTPAAWSRNPFGGFYERNKDIEEGMPYRRLFRNIAEHGFTAGFDAETVAMRERAGNLRLATLRPRTAESKAWWEALGMLHDVVPEAKEHWFSVLIKPEDDLRFKRDRCATISAELERATVQVLAHLETQRKSGR